MAGGVSAGILAQSGSAAITRPSVSAGVAPSKARVALSISNSTHPNAQMSDA